MESGQQVAGELFRRRPTLRHAPADEARIRGEDKREVIPTEIVAKRSCILGPANQAGERFLDGSALVGELRCTPGHGGEEGASESTGVGIHRAQ